MKEIYNRENVGQLKLTLFSSGGPEKLYKLVHAYKHSIQTIRDYHDIII